METTPLSTFARRNLTKRRIELMASLSLWHAKFDEVWLRLKGRVGGFNDRDVDTILTTGDCHNPFSETENQDFFNRMRALPDHIIRVVCTFFPLQ